MPQENPRFLKLRALTTVAVIAFGLLAGCAPSTESATEAVEPRVTVTIQAEPTAISTPAIPEEPPDYCQPPTKGRNQCNTIYSGDLAAIQSLEFEAQDLFFYQGRISQNRRLFSFLLVTTMMSIVKPEWLNF